MFSPAEHNQDRNDILFAFEGGGKPNDQILAHYNILQRTRA
jgi:hypothetical protein